MSLMSITPEVIAEFVSTLTRSQRTAATYAGALSRWRVWLDGREATRETAQQWIDDLKRTRRADNTVATYAAAIRRFCRWRDGSRVYLDSPGVDVGEPKYHSAEEIARMIELGGPLERTVVALMFDTGCRISELLNLKRQDVDRDRRLLTVTAKGGDRQQVNITEAGLRYLGDWLAVRRGNPPDLFWPYLPGTTSDQKTQAIRVRLERLAKAAGIDGFTPHHLRHSRAMDLLNSGVTLERVSELLRHKNLQVTAKIYGKRRPEDRQADLEQGTTI